LDVFDFVLPAVADVLAVDLEVEPAGDKAIEQLEAAYKIALADLPAGLSQLTNVLGVAYLKYHRGVCGGKTS
jgi:hypothetical protein